MWTRASVFLMDKLVHFKYVNKLKTFINPFIFKTWEALYYTKAPCLLYDRNDIIIGMVIEFGGVKNGKTFSRRSKARC